MYDFLFRNLITPFYYWFKNYNRIKYYKELNKRNSLTQEEIKAIQWKKLKALLDHSYKNIPYYRKIFCDLGICPEDIKNLQDYSKLPELGRIDINNNFEDLIDPKLPKDKLFYTVTSGSTGVPLKIARSPEGKEYSFALKYRSNGWCGWKYWHKSVWFVTDVRHITQLNKLKGRSTLWIQRRLMIDTKNITRKSMFEWANQIKTFKPEYVYGYSSLLAKFSEFLLENNLNIDGIKGVYSTAESLTKRDIISKAFNAPVYDQYGASEIPCIAHECIKGNMHINSDEILVEFADIAPNSELKRMICTPLYEYGAPLLRYDIQDCAVPIFKECDCGLPYPVMELKVGRIGDNLLSPTGKLVSGVELSWYIPNSAQGIKQYQIIQENISDFTVKLISNTEFREENEENIRILLSKTLNTSDINIRFEYPEKIIPGKNGKFRPTISKVLDGSKDTCNKNIINPVCSIK